MCVCALTTHLSIHVLCKCLVRLLTGRYCAFSRAQRLFHLSLNSCYLMWFSLSYIRDSWENLRNSPHLVPTKPELVFEQASLVVCLHAHSVKKH